jgi:fatty acid desaturase
MKYNIENINKTEVVRSDGLNYQDFRKSLSPHYYRVWQDISQAYFYIFFFMILSLSLERITGFWFLVFVPFMSLVLGFCIAHLRLFAHEAVHENIHKNKKINDLLANIFLCSWFGIDLNKYRKKHRLHHNLLGTTEDSEKAYFNNLSIKFILNHLSGFCFINKIFSQIKKQKFNKKRRNILPFAIRILLNTSIILFCIEIDLWQSAIVWTLAALIFFPFFSELRQILEHRNELTDPKKDFYKENHGKTSRIFKSTFLSKIFGAAGFNRHLLHHWDPEISYTRFDELEDFLMDTSQCWVSICDSKTTYFDTFLFLLVFRENYR